MSQKLIKADCGSPLPSQQSSGRSSSCAGFALAEEAQTPAGGYRHWLTDLAPPLAGVETQHWFPDHPGARFTVGGPVRSLNHKFIRCSLSTDVESGMQVDVVLGLHNSAGEAFNITHIAGSINSPQAFQYYVQNFTLKVGTLNSLEPLSIFVSWLENRVLVGSRLPRSILSKCLFTAAIQLLLEAW